MNNKITFFSFILLLFFVLGHFTFKIHTILAKNNGKTFIFSKNLKIGDKNEDVRNLQKILNQNIATKVSSSGIGSYGNESSYFGEKTKNAIIKFQELYASDILTPYGFKSGTGFVGTSTRLKLNFLTKKDEENSLSVSVSGNSSSQKKTYSSSRAYKVVSESSQSKEKITNSSSSVSSSFFGTEEVFVRVYNTSEYQVSPGDSVILTGEGFTSSSNTIHLGENRSISNLSSSEGTKISFAIPKDLPLGKYSVWATNANGTSKSETIKIYIVITDNPTERPVIEKVEPSETTIDSEIVISGKGFTASGNNIYSMFGNIMNISSPDGKTIKFKATSMAQLAKLANNKNVKNTEAEIWFYVVNDNGYNKEPASFIIKF